MHFLIKNMESQTLEIRKKVPTLKDLDITYFSPLQMVGSGTWLNVHNSNYGLSPLDGSQQHQQTFPQAARLFIYAIAHRKKPEMQPVIGSVNGSGKVLTGDTLCLWHSEYLYGIDHPDEELIAQLGVDNPKALSQIKADLDAKLKGRLGRKVKTSSNGLVRRTKREYIIFGEQNRQTFARNPGLVVLVGDYDPSKGLSEATRAYALNPGLYGADGNTVKVPVLSASGFDYGLDVDGSRLVAYGDGCSFGGSLSGEATRKNK